MTHSITLTLPGGTSILVPDSLDVITTYVLLEQGDWFEDEIRFLRKALQPGEKVIDIGANFGVYTLSMSARVGATGRLWAFEPASTTAAFLAQSLAANDFKQATLVQCALSDHSGEARLHLGASAELNSLEPSMAGGEDSETVRLATLDECMAEHGWRDISFLKIDAEGTEEKILHGGSRFLDAESPLIQFEVADTDTTHLELVRAFEQLGYQSYRLVPGLNVLVPFDDSEPVKQFLLNLFACKPDRAARLATRGLLCRTEDIDHATGGLATRIEAVDGAPGAPAWLARLLQLPYGEACRGLWERTLADGMDPRVTRGLSCYRLAHDASLTAVERFVALRRSLAELSAACADSAGYLRLSSQARVAREYGARGIAAQALLALCRKLMAEHRADPAEPFLSPGTRFDTVPPGRAVAKWILAAALEEYERCRTHSSIYQGADGLQNLRAIRDLGFAGAEITRRLELLTRRSAAFGDADTGAG